MKRLLSKIQLIQAELAVSRLLRYGVLASGAVIALGWVQLVAGKNSENSTLATLMTGDTHLIFSGFNDLLLFLLKLSQLDPIALIYLGLVLLIALPILRVILSVLIFILQKDYLFAFLSFLVFSLLMMSLYLGKTH